MSTAKDWCVPGGLDHADAIHDVVIAGDSLIARAREVDPLEDRVLGRVGDLPFAGLHVDRDAREGAVLAGVIDVEVAVRDGDHVIEAEVRLREDVGDASRLDPVARVQLGVAEAEPRVEQDDPAPVADGITHHDAATVGEGRVREPEVGKVERDDLRDASHWGLAAGVVVGRRLPGVVARVRAFVAAMVAR